MIHKLRALFVSLLLFSPLILGSAAIAAPAPAAVPAATTASCQPTFITIDLYDGLRSGSGCTELDPNKMKSFAVVTTLLVNVVKMALELAGLLAVGFIIYGAILYIMSQGQPENIKKAKDTIVNAVIGMVLAILAFVIVALIATGATGTII